MPTVSTKITTYTYALAEITKLIASDLNVPIEAITVQYNVRDSFDDSLSRSASYNVQDVTVVVDMTKVETEKNDCLTRRLAQSELGMI